MAIELEKYARVKTRYACKKCGKQMYYPQLNFMGTGWLKNIN